MPSHPMTDSAQRRAAFMDRDDTINRDVDYLSSPDDLELMPGVPEALRLLERAGFLRIVITNQSAVARGMVSLERLEEIHAALHRMLEREGAGLDAIYYCPHHPEGSVQQYAVECDCRKPQPGLIHRAAQDWNIDTGRSIMVGDSLGDIEAGNRAGCTTFLVTNGRDADLTGIPAEQRPDYAVNDLLEAARFAAPGVD